MAANKNGIELLLQDPGLDAGLRAIAAKVSEGERISESEGLYLFEKADLGYLGVLANYVRESKHGDNTYFNRNFHLEPTNICVYTCTFCSYSRLIKKLSEVWEYTLEEMLELVKKH